MTAKRVVLAMSGGVDSSAAAVLLHRQGYEVIGLFMRSGETQDTCDVSPTDLLPVLDTPAHRQGCCSSEDAADARRVADDLGISFHSLNFREAFRRIKDYFADEYISGRTPNPCVQCNNWLKFGRLWDFAQQIGADHIATGHYARITTDLYGQHQLYTGIDPQKDQSYVLFGLRRELLSKVLLPVGNFHKSQIRAFADEAGLKVANKKDSYEICFVPDNDYAGFLNRYRGQLDTAGDFVDTDGHVLGQHAGYERFTVGQRRGLGIAFGEPRFVVSVKPESRQVVLGRREDLAVSQVIATQLNWLVDRPADEFRCRVALRYQQRTSPCSVSVDENDRAVIRLDEETFGVAPGQASVFYDEDRVLGGGWIQSTVS
ncbi:MAG: tRNA 2-thiouridine(34) synthase MnmA [Fuerstiella sp.]|nr:tRNA 2-thiouridine(34) synthase MnmA [Fuerstiella sp.]